MVTPDGAQAFPEISNLDRPTLQPPTIEKIGDFRGLSNPLSTPENENPGALAGATGAEFSEQVLKPQAYPTPRVNAMSLYAKDGHKRACRMLGYALTLNDPTLWGHTAAILSHRLTGMELVSLAFTVMSALEPGDREAVFDAAQWGVA